MSQTKTFSKILGLGRIDGFKDFGELHILNSMSKEIFYRTIRPRRLIYKAKKPKNK